MSFSNIISGAISGLGQTGNKDINGFLNKINTSSFGKNMLGGDLLGSASGILQGIASGRASAVVASGIKLALNFIPGGQIISQIAGPLIDWGVAKIANWWNKRKAKKAAKKFNKMVQQLQQQAATAKTAVQTELSAGRITPEEAKQKLDKIDSDMNTAILSKFKSLSPKEQERIQKYAGSVPAAAEAWRAVTNAQSSLQNLEYNKLISGIYNPSSMVIAGLDISTYNPNALNHAYNDASLLWAAWTKDAAGNTVRNKVAASDVAIWADVNLKNAKPVPSSDDFDASIDPLTAKPKNSAAEIEDSTKTLIDFVGRLKADNTTQNHELVRNINPESFRNNPAAAQEFMKRFEAFEDKVEKLGANAENGLSAEDKAFVLAADRIEGEIALSNPEAAVATIINGYGLKGKLSLDDYKAASNANPNATAAEKLSIAIMKKADINPKDGVLDRDEVMQMFGVSKPVLGIYDMLENTKIGLDDFKKWLEDYKKNNPALAYVDFYKNYGSASLPPSYTNIFLSGKPA